LISTECNAISAAPLREVLFVALLPCFLAVKRRGAGVELYQVQLGLEPTNWKPMPNVGHGVREIRIQANGSYRVIYLAMRPEAIYILHCFQKKSQKTAPRDLELARQRYKQIGV
jgi:phage-related protein